MAGAFSRSLPGSCRSDPDGGSERHPPPPPGFPTGRALSPSQLTYATATIATATTTTIA